LRKTKQLNPVIAMRSKHRNIAPQKVVCYDQAGKEIEFPLLFNGRKEFPTNGVNTAN
jgi:hypothetical protein